MEALKAGRRTIYEIYTAKKKTPPRLEPLMELAGRKHIPVTRVKDATLASLAGGEHHQGVGARVSPYPCADIAEIPLPKPDEAVGPFLLLLDTVVDPHNFGALVRTALCVGVNAVIILKDRSAAPTPAVSKASAGALEHMTVVRVTNMVKTIDLLKSKGIWIAGLNAAAGSSIFTTDLTGPLGIVIGGEEKGIRPLVRQNCDFLLSIPQTGLLDSLNASVAGAVVMYEVFRQRTCKSTKT